jgi:hypothetical protein
LTKNSLSTPLMAPPSFRLIVQQFTEKIKPGDKPTG